MLRLEIPDTEYYDEASNEFVSVKGASIMLEHSLVSLAKWESKFHKPFMREEPLTIGETVEYIRCMTVTQNVRDEVYAGLTQRNIEEVNAYIDDPMTATWFSDRQNGSSGSSRGPAVTAEIIYYWMIELGVPMECQKWHLNRLLTIIRVCMLKRNPQKMTRQDQFAQQRALNAKRRAAAKTRG